MGRRVVSVQRAAHLDVRLMQRSAWSVISCRDDAAPGDARWREGYAEVVIPAFDAYQAAWTARDATRDLEAGSGREAG